MKLTINGVPFDLTNATFDITIPETATASATVPSATGAGVAAAPVQSPAPAPAPSGTVTVTGTLADGTAVNLSLSPGQRLPLVAGKIVGSAIYHADGLSVCIENAYAGTLGDLSGTFTITAGSARLFSGPLTIWAYSRTRPFWVTPPTLLASPDLSLFPQYGAGSSTASMAAAYAAADNSPTGYGVADPRMSDTGEEANLGPLPAWDACYLTNPSTANAAVVRGMSDSASVWGFHAIDPTTNAMLDVTKVPKASFGWYSAGDPIVAYTTADPKTLSEAQAHAPVFSALACAVYGTDYDKEELSFWANYVQSLWQNPGYRLPAGCVSQMHTQTRGNGRGLVVLLYAAKLSDKAAYFDAWVQATAADLWGGLDAQTGLQIQQAGAVVYPNHGFAPWQNHILAYGVALGVKLGYTQFQPSLDYLAIPIMDAVNGSYHEMATSYNVCLADAAGTIAPDWTTALNYTALVNPKVAAAMAQPEDSLARIQALEGSTAGYIAGDFAGYPTSATGYAACAQPALALIAKFATDQTNAQAAWAKFKKYARADYSVNPKYNVIG